MSWIEKARIEMGHWGKNVLIILVLSATIFITREVAWKDPASAVLEKLKPLSLNGFHRLLILAPHCDDETLGSAGLILAAQRAGIEVRVVIATNGDGFIWATMQDFRKLYPHPIDFIRMGTIRQQESLAALAMLGVKPEQVSFLSYPDRGTPALWNDHWNPDNAYKSPYSGDSKSPYSITYNPKSVYAGLDYLADLTSILKDYHPDFIIYPHPDDVHPDHWGLNAFTRLALTLIEHGDPAYRPAEFTYLVHRPDYPEVSGLKPQESLLPPDVLYRIDQDWYRWDLTTTDTTIKDRAVHEYRSQLPLLRGLMESFVRRNELFAPTTNTGLTTVAQGNPLDPSTWVDAAGQTIPPVQRDPVHDLFVRDAVPASDLVALYATRNSSNMLWMCAQLNEEAGGDVAYVLQLKALIDNGIVDYGARTSHPKQGWNTAKKSGVYVCDQVSLASLGHPWAIFVGAESIGPRSFTLDQIAWEMVYINSNDKP